MRNITVFTIILFCIICIITYNNHEPDPKSLNGFTLQRYINKKMIVYNDTLLFTLFENYTLAIVNYTQEDHLYLLEDKCLKLLDKSYDDNINVNEIHKNIMSLYDDINKSSYQYQHMLVDYKLARHELLAYVKNTHVEIYNYMMALDNLFYYKKYNSILNYDFRVIQKTIDHNYDTYIKHNNKYKQGHEVRTILQVYLFIIRDLIDLHNESVKYTMNDSIKFIDVLNFI